jgi:hypothetical protein
LVLLRRVTENNVLPASLAERLLRQTRITRQAARDRIGDLGDHRRLVDAPIGARECSFGASSDRSFGLAEMVDEVIPCCWIVAGDWEATAPWRNKRRNARDDGSSFSPEPA